MAMSLNRAQIIGHLTRDPELRQTPNGQAVCSFGVATNFTWTDQSGNRQEKVEFHNVVAWRRLAEICAQYLKKGGKVYIDGRLQTREWEGQDGVKRQRTEIIMENMIMLDRKEAGAASAAGMQQIYKGTGVNSQPAVSPAPQPENNVQQEVPSEGAAQPSEEEVTIDDLPF